MKITHHIPAALVLGSVFFAGSHANAEETGVGAVELIPFPEGVTSWVNAYFSDDGQLQLLHNYTQNNSDIYQYRDGDWVLIRRELRTPVPGITPMSVSSDGSVIVLTDFFRTDVLMDAAVMTMPRTWMVPEQHNDHTHDRMVWGSVRGGEISRDGRVVTMSGWESDRHDGDSLIWMGGDDLVNISASLPREDHSYTAGFPDADGSVIAFGADTPSGDRVWVWEDGELTEVPSLDPDADQPLHLRAVSADGQAVFGVTDGPRRGSLGYRDALTEVTDWDRPTSRASTAWMWTRATGTVEIIDRSRFLETDLVDIDANGEIALLYARLHGRNTASLHLWLGGNKFVELNELFHTLNISIDADWYGFNEISDDGTKLMGLASVDGQTYSHAIIVTIPDLTP